MGGNISEIISIINEIIVLGASTYAFFRGLKKTLHFF